MFTMFQPPQLQNHSYTYACDVQAQLVLFYFSIDAVKEHLEAYFLKSRQLIKDDRSLCLLCIQCFEVSFSVQYNSN